MIYTNRLIIARSSVRRKTRGCSLPDCGLGVTVPECQRTNVMFTEATASQIPISMKPNPNLVRPSMASPLLSKPAARPIGFLNCRCQTVEC